ncbi:hypothetical protein VCHA53O466_50197 [Vibrio chagasii]|nr:hypothetical protein VCHA53O466_50197 [Vibrio chagasii]
MQGSVFSVKASRYEGAKCLYLRQWNASTAYIKSTMIAARVNHGVELKKPAAVSRPSRFNFCSD